MSKTINSLAIFSLLASIIFGNIWYWGYEVWAGWMCGMFWIILITCAIFMDD